MNWDFIEIIGFTVGLIYLWLEYHANPLMWLASVIMPVFSIYIYYSRGLYADFGINIYYFIIAVYGYIHWTCTGKTGNGKKKNRDVSHTPLPAWGGIALGLASIWAGLWYILTTVTDSTVPVADSFTTALSIVAMWMLAKKWAEQWLAWLVVDAACVGLYIYKGIYFYATLYAIYTVIAILGYRKWCRMIPVNNHSTSNSKTE